MANRTMSKTTISAVNLRIDSHEKICAERMAELLSRVKRLESIILASGGATILLLATLFFK
jgi:hypothetical protein